MRIFVEDSFDSAHRLPNVPPTHKCANIHGHTYRIRLEIGGDVDPRMGWIIDYRDVKSVWDAVKEKLDHRSLNYVDGLENPTCENIAAWIWDALKPDLPGLARIELRETEHCGVVLEGRGCWV
jgi:6-pyruvoyltetrahydropterin/6-carboxytetrahydropterin synthase